MAAWLHRSAADCKRACLCRNDARKAQSRAKLQCAWAPRHDVCVGCQIVCQELGGRPHDLPREVIVSCMYSNINTACCTGLEENPKSAHMHCCHCMRPSESVDTVDDLVTYDLMLHARAGPKESHLKPTRSTAVAAYGCLLRMSASHSCRSSTRFGTRQILEAALAQNRTSV